MNYKEEDILPTKPKPPTVDQLREAMKADRLMGHSKVRAARDAESALAKEGKAKGKAIPTPINDWCLTDEYRLLLHPEGRATATSTASKPNAKPKGTTEVATARKAAKKAGARKAPANKKAAAPRGAGKPRIAEADRVPTIKRYVDKGMTTESEIVTEMRSHGIPVGPWIKPILAKLVGGKKVPAKKAAATKKAPARKRATPSELSKAHQTRGKGKKAPAAASRRRAPKARVVKRTPRRRAA